MLNDKEIAEEICKRYGMAVSERGTLDSHCEEIAQRILPNYKGTFTSWAGQTPGQKNTQEMIDATGALALTRFAAAMESMLTPRSSTWHTVSASDRSLMKDRDTRLWFDELTETLFRYRYAPKANFASQKHEDYMSLGAFGTGALFIDQLDKRYGPGLRYSAVHLGQIHFLTNHQGIVDTAFRRFELTARQAKQEFGDMLPADIITAAGDTKNCDKKYWFIHCVKPREEVEGYDPKRLDVKGFAFASYYIAEERKEVVKEGGFANFPYAVSRYVVAPGEVYGRSPAMMALPSIKTLNEQKKTVLRQGHRALDPVLLAHDDGVMDSFQLKSGAINFGGVTAEGRPLVHALPVGNLAVGEKMMEMERAVINDFFLVSLFQILIDTPAMTATEVLERAREKGALLSPTMGRQQSESLGPMIEREVDLLMLQGLLRPMPQALKEARGEYDIIYDSPLSRAQKAESVSGFFRVIDWAREYVAITQDPSPLDWVNFDGAMPDILDSQGVLGRWQNDLAAVQQIRAGRSQQNQVQQAIQAAPAAAAVMKAQTA